MLSLACPRARRLTPVKECHWPGAHYLFISRAAPDDSKCERDDWRRVEWPTADRRRRRRRRRFKKLTAIITKQPSLRVNPLPRFLCFPQKNSSLLAGPTDFHFPEPNFTTNVYSLVMRHSLQTTAITHRRFNYTRSTDSTDSHRQILLFSR
jgi:hypothetical protein